LGQVEQPLIIGVAGGTGSGKTTIAHRIAESAVPGAVTILEHDAYYRDRSDLTYEDRCGLNFDHPDSLETSLLVEHLRDLKAGSPADVPAYDFTTHSRKPDRQRVLPTRVIIVEGILVFVHKELRELFDIKIFVDTAADIRAFRRIRRDIEHRGRSFSSIREQYYATVRPMHMQFVEPSKRWADIIIPEGGNNRVALDLIIGRLHRVLNGP
jgi:uridine kinase